MPFTNNPIIQTILLHQWQAPVNSSQATCGLVLYSRLETLQALALPSLFDHDAFTALNVQKLSRGTRRFVFTSENPAALSCWDN